jgi:WD40 repeat protein
MRWKPVVAAAFLLLIIPVDPAMAAPKAVDEFGDPLPPGAVRRFGKVRFSSYPDLLFPSADGKTIRCLRYGVHVLTFDRATGRLIGTDSLPAEPAWELGASSNGRRVVLVRRPTGYSAPQLFEVWDLVERKLVAKLGPFDRLGWAFPSISPDGRLVAITGEKWTPDRRQLHVRVWDVDRGKELSSTEFETLTSRGGGWMNYGQFSSDGRKLRFSTGTGSETLIQCLDSSTLTMRWERRLTGTGDIVGETPDGKLLMQNPSAVAALALADGENSKVHLPPDYGRGSFVGFVNQGKTLLYTVTEGKRRQLKAWDWASARPPEEFPPISLGPNSWVLANVSRDSQDVLIHEGAWRLYDLKTGKPVWPDSSNVGHTGAVTALTFSADGKRLASAGADNRVRVWDVQNARQLGEWETIGPFPSLDSDSPRTSTFGRIGPTSIDLNADGSRLVFAGPRASEEMEKLQVVDTRTGRIIASKTLPKEKAADGNDIGFGHLGFSPPGDSVFVVHGEADGNRLREPIDRLARWDFLSDRWNEISSFEQSPAAHTVWSRAHERFFVRGRAFDARTGKEVFDLPGAIDGPLACSPDGRLVAGIGGFTNRTFGFEIQMAEDIRVWDGQSGALLVRLPWQPRAEIREVYPALPPDALLFPGDSLSMTWPRRLAMHPGGRWLAAADPSGVRLWDLLHGRVIHTFPVPFRPSIDQHHGSPATALAFSPDGKHLATGSPDGTILFWTVPSVAASRLASRELDDVWSDLVGPDPVRGWRAVWRISEDPKAAIELVRQRLKPATAIDEAKVRQWIADLDSPNYRTREQATRQLEAVADRTSQSLIAAAKSSKMSAEARERLYALSRQAPAAGRPLTARAGAQSRLVAVLESANTVEARKLLRELAHGDADAWLTREARQALSRLESR